MNRTTIKRLTWTVLVVLAIAARAAAQSEAGTVAAVAGTLQVHRAGSWQSASIGVPIFVGDRLRTGSSDRAKIVLADDSVLDIGPDTEVTLDTQIFERPRHRFQSLLRLAKGKIRAWVSDYYREPRARYEVETPTAIIGVRGTEFIVVYVPPTEATDVVGIAETVEVAGKLGVMGGSVQVGPRLFTRVEKGRFPSAPQRLDEAAWQQYLQGVDLIGTGRRDGLNVFHPAVMGRVLSPADVPQAVAGSKALAPAEGLPFGAPEPFLASRLSPDVYTNTQPLLEFEQTPPGQVPTGSVKVGF